MNSKDIDHIEKIMKLMEEHGLTELKLEQEETKLSLKKGGEADLEAMRRLIASSAPMMTAPQPAPSAPTFSGIGEAPASGPPAGLEEIKSPMVGTFYTSEKPDSPPFVKPGDKVSSDTKVCIIEAMKVFNEIEAEIKGEIVEVLVENGTPVQFGEALFLVKP